MRAPTNLDRRSFTLNMTPMIDVVFLLIIFFLLSSHLARQEASVELDLPEAISSRPADFTGPVRRLTINVLADARWLIAGQHVDRDELARIVDVERRLGEGRLEVRIRCDRQVHYSAVEPVLVACARADVWNVGFAVIKQKP